MRGSPVPLPPPHPRCFPTGPGKPAPSRVEGTGLRRLLPAPGEAPAAGGAAEFPSSRRRAGLGAELRVAQSRRPPSKRSRALLPLLTCGCERAVASPRGAKLTFRYLPELVAIFHHRISKINSTSEEAPGKRPAPCSRSATCFYFLFFFQKVNTNK